MLNVALPKGRLGDTVYKLFSKIGYECGEFLSDDRKLVIEGEKARYLLVKPSDVGIYVEHGAADVGVVGKDVLVETGADVYELLDLGIGKCRLCVAAREDFIDDRNRVLRVASKYTNSAAAYYKKLNRQIELIKLSGSIELAPILGLSDVIVDIVESGRTLKENHLKVFEEIFLISARFIVNRSSYQFKSAEIGEMLAKLREEIGECK
ncbi:MAG: ATP phosphoribosyltransferase [Clostridia bacterium]|nr:ATP phosphoribosyltransferase [Clostridia bacterium]